MDHDLHRRCRGINHRVCTALDMTKLTMALDEMKAAGLDEREARSFETAAAALLAMIRSANHRVHGEEPVGPN